MAWDTRPVHRLERFPGYKSSRKPTPSLLKQQQPYLRPLVEAFGYRNVELEGYEADDVIGTLSLRADEQGIATCVISHDRDAFQLVSEHVCVLLSPRGVTDVHVYTPERVEARYGIPPRLVPDFIGLKGDTSDDIPGRRRASATRRPPTCSCASARSRASTRTCDAVPGEKRRQTLIEHREDARALEAAGDDRARPRRSTSTSRRRWPSRPTGRPWESSSAASSSARCCVASTSSRRRCRGAASSARSTRSAGERGDGAALARRCSAPRSRSASRATAPGCSAWRAATRRC